jgi:hypothetical protein
VSPVRRQPLRLVSARRGGPDSESRSRLRIRYSRLRIGRLVHILKRLAVSANGCFWRILLKKSFWEGERKFLEPLMRFARGDVRYHIVSSEIDHGPP